MIKRSKEGQEKYEAQLKRLEDRLQAVQGDEARSKVAHFNLAKFKLLERYGVELIELIELIANAFTETDWTLSGSDSLNDHNAVTYLEANASEIEELCDMVARVSGNIRLDGDVIEEVLKDTARMFGEPMPQLSSSSYDRVAQELEDYLIND